MNDGSIDTLSDIKVSKVTLSFLCSLVGLAGFITWNASSIANRIGELEETVVMMQAANNGADSAVLERLGNLEKQITNIGPIDTEDIEEDVGDIEELLEEISRRMDEDISWQLGDLFHRTDVMMSLLREKEWAKETLDREFGPNWGW
jgi:hypothetical protein